MGENKPRARVLTFIIWNAFSKLFSRGRYIKKIPAYILSLATLYKKKKKWKLCTDVESFYCGRSIIERDRDRQRDEFYITLGKRSVTLKSSTVIKFEKNEIWITIDIYGYVERWKLKKVSLSSSHVIYL